MLCILSPHYINLHFSSSKKTQKDKNFKMTSSSNAFQKNIPTKKINVEKQSGKSKTHSLQRFEYIFFPKVTLARIPCFAKSFYYAKEQFHICWIFLCKSKYASKVLLGFGFLGFLQFEIYLGFGVFFKYTIYVL